MLFLGMNQPQLSLSLEVVSLFIYLFYLFPYFIFSNLDMYFIFILFIAYLFLGNTLYFYFLVYHFMV